MGEVLELTAKDGLTYPLHFDPEKSIGEHLQHHAFCSNSFKFGPQADNILGLNIRIGEKILKAGGRTVKNCTGFDLVRFIVGQCPKSIEIQDVVLRLRPLKPQRLQLKIQGGTDQLLAFKRHLLNHPWSYEIDAFDFMFKDGELTYFLSIPCLDNEVNLANSFFEQAAKNHGLQISHGGIPQAPEPSVQWKTTITDLISRSTRLAIEHESVTYGYCGNGFGFMDTTLDETSLQREQEEPSQWGGHLIDTRQGPVCSLLEKTLLNKLEHELTALGQS
jgi:hypothetical protein